MYRSLTPEPLEIRARPARRALSRRRVKALVTPGQTWVDAAGAPWTLAAIHHKDGLVRLERHRAGWTREARFPTFGELGRHYRLEPGE